MPMYDYECEECGNHFEAIQPMRLRDDALSCECGGQAHRFVSPSNLGGILFSNTRVLGNGEFTAQSNADVRRYEKETGMVHVSPSETRWKEMKYSARNQAEKIANKAGFGSLGAQREFAKKHLNNKRNET